jgi:hypothetical protein
VPKKKPFSKSRINSKHKVKNWSSYNEYLRKRGRIDGFVAQIKNGLNPPLPKILV